MIRESQIHFWIGLALFFSAIFYKPTRRKLDALLGITEAWRQGILEETRPPNCLEDVPKWVRVLPTEVCNANIEPMLQRLKMGSISSDDAKSDLVHRVCAGSRMITFDSRDRLRQVIAFEENALVLLPLMLTRFSALPSRESETEDARVRRVTGAVMHELGLPRVWQSEDAWLLG